MALLLIDLFGVNYELPEAFNFDMLVLVIRPAEQKSTRQSMTHNLEPTRGTTIVIKKELKPS